MANIPISPNMPVFDARLRIAYDSTGLPQKVDIPNERIYRFYPGFYDYYPFKQSNLLEHCVADFYFSQDDGRGNWERCAIAPRCKKGENIVTYPNGKPCDCCGDTMRVEREIRYYPDE